MGKENNNKKNTIKEKFKFTEYHLLLVSAAIFILQYSYFSVNTINFPKWIYLGLIIVAIIVNLIIKRAKTNILLNWSELTRVFKTFIVYFFLTFSIGLFFFGVVNKTFANNEDLEFLELKIIRAYENSSKSSNKIYFLLDNKEYGISVPSSPEISNLIKNKENLRKSYILLDCKKGIFGTYIIEEKKIIIK
nr:hypothetical protein [uncultured Bacteroides sp.]